MTKSFPSVRAKRQYERERDAEILRRRIIDVIQSKTSVTMPQLVDALPDVRPQLLYEVCRRMRVNKRIVSCTLKNRIGQFVVWALDPKDLVDAEARHPSTSQQYEDDSDWKPTKWVHPIRARALGLPVARSF
jgi:hypothetical protein